MGIFGSKQKMEPCIHYSNRNNLQVDNVKVYKSESKVEQSALSLNDRIKNLTESLASCDEDLSPFEAYLYKDLEAFFYKKLREINASTGNGDIQNSLLRLRDTPYKTYK